MNRIYRLVWCRARGALVVASELARSPHAGAGRGRGGRVPLLLTALCTALPAQMGLVIIGGEGAFVMGGLGAMAAGLACADAGLPPLAVQLVMAIAGMLAGGALIAAAGGLRHWRGVNETISSLLLTYIGIAIMNFFVEGALRDLSNPNKPSTMPIGDAYMIGKIPGTQVHWGFAYGIMLCVALYFLMARTTFGFHHSTPRPHATTPPMPAASATRTTVPALPGSATSTSTSTASDASTAPIGW